MIEYGWPLAAPRTLAERIAEMTEAARYLHGDLLDLAADLGAEMHAEPTYHDGYETGRRDEAQAQAAMRITPRDVRVGDVLAITYTVTVTGQDDEYNISTDDSDRRQHNLHAYNASARLLDRPDPDPRVAVIEAWMQDYATDTADLLARLDALGTWVPRPTTGDLHA